MSLPFSVTSVTSYTAKLIQDQQAQTIGEVLSQVQQTPWQPYLSGS